MPRGPKGPDIRDVTPTIVHLDCTWKFNGGTLSNDAISRVWAATTKAFEKAAHKNGMGYCWTGSVSCIQPAQMERRIEKIDLQVEMPPADPAVVT
jgi:hypothetical protein